MRPFVKISSKVHSAVMLVSFVANEEDRFPVPLSMISKYLKLSRRYLDQVAKSLKTAGILKSYQGSAGGYRLSHKNITMLDVIEAIEGPISIMHCIGGTKCKVEQKCPSKSIWPELQKEIKKSLEKIIIV